MATSVEVLPSPTGNLPLLQEQKSNEVASSPSEEEVEAVLLSTMVLADVPVVAVPLRSRKVSAVAAVVHDWQAAMATEILLVAAATRGSPAAQVAPTAP